MDNKRYYYLRLKDNFFDSDEILVLESMPDGILFSNILLKLYLRSLKNNGKLMLNDRIPYNAIMLSQITRQPVAVVEKAIAAFVALGLVEVLDNGAIFMLDIQSFIGESSTEADRKRLYRNRIEAEKTRLIGTFVQTNVGQMSDKNPPEIEIEKEIEIEIDKEIEMGTPFGVSEPKIANDFPLCPYGSIIDKFNETCVSFPRVVKCSTNRKRAIKARWLEYDKDEKVFSTLFEKAEASSFLKGDNNRNWSATFDWLVNSNNMAKVLEGNYDDKTSSPKSSSTWDDALRNLYGGGLNGND